MPGDTFTPLPGVEEDTQQPELTGADFGNPSDFATQHFKKNYDQINSAFDEKSAIVRAALMPDDDVIQQDKDAEIAELKKLYDARLDIAKSEGLDRVSMNKKMTALNSSYKSDEYSITAKYDKLARQQNKEYDRQKMQLDIQRKSILDEADKKHTYMIGQMHTYDELVADGHLTADQANRRKFALFGINISEPKTPDQQRNYFLSQIGDLDARLSQFSEKPVKGGGTIIQVAAKDEDGKTTVREATPQEVLYKTALTTNRAKMQNEVVKLTFANDPTVVARSQIGRLASTKTKTGNMETSMTRGPSQTKAQEQQKALAPRKLDKATAKQFYDQARGDKELARRLAAAAGYK